MLRIAQILFAACLGFAAATLSARAAELVMVEQDGCHWCERWNAEIGHIHPKTEEGLERTRRRHESAALQHLPL